MAWLLNVIEPVQTRRHRGRPTAEHVQFGQRLSRHPRMDWATPSNKLKAIAVAAPYPEAFAAPAEAEIATE
jgi:hypothetical protein